MSTGHPGRQEYCSVAREGIFVICVLNACGPVGVGVPAGEVIDLVVTGGVVGMVEWDSAADFCPPQAEVVKTVPAVTARITRFITSGLHVVGDASCIRAKSIVSATLAASGTMTLGPDMPEYDHWLDWQGEDEPPVASQDQDERRRYPSFGIREIMGVASGFITFVLVNTFMMYSAFEENIIHGKNMSLLAQALALLVLAFGLGGLLAWKLEGLVRLFGIGLMTGWTFMTLFSLGFCTGLT